MELLPRDPNRSVFARGNALDEDGCVVDLRGPDDALPVDRVEVKPHPYIMERIDVAHALVTHALHHGRTSLSTCMNQPTMCEHVEAALAAALEALQDVRNEL